MNKSVTVVIPTYNAGRFIAETLESVLTQTLLPGEIIVVDDASNDDTVAIVRAIARTAKVPIQILVQHIGSGGPAVPLNVGVAAVKSKYVALLDHDDRMRPEKLARQVAALEASDAKMVFSDCYLFSTDNDRLSAASGRSKLSKDHILRFQVKHRAGESFSIVPAHVMLQEQLLNAGIVQSCSNLLFQRDLWKLYGPFDPDYTVIADYIFKLNVAMAAVPTAFISDVLFDKQCHDNNLFDSTAQAIVFKEIYTIIFNTIQLSPENTIRDQVFWSRFQTKVLNDTYLWCGRGHTKLVIWIYASFLRNFGASSKALMHAVKLFYAFARYRIGRVLREVRAAFRNLAGRHNLSI